MRALEPDGLGWSPGSFLKKELRSGQMAAALAEHPSSLGHSSGKHRETRTFSLFRLLLKEVAKDSRLWDRAGGRAKSEDSPLQPWQDQRCGNTQAQERGRAGPTS